jgi:hypothetical protein
MDSHVKGALIIGAAILIATAAWIYWSPMQQYIRTFKASFGDTAPRACFAMIGTRGQ